MLPWSNRQSATLLPLAPLHVATTCVACQSFPYRPTPPLPSCGGELRVRVPSVAHDKKSGTAVFTPPPHFHHTPHHPLKTTYLQGTAILQKHRALRIVYPSANTLLLQPLKDLHPDNLHPPPGYPSAL